MTLIDNQYQVKIGNQDFSDIIALDNGHQWTINSFSAELATGQTIDGKFRIPILGERVQLIYTCPSYISKERIYDLVDALELGTTGQREIEITYDDVLFGWITHNFYCVNIPWIKAKLPDYPHHYGKGIKFQLASSAFMKRQVIIDAPKLTPKFADDSEYQFKINTKDFSDIIAIEGFKGQYIDQSLESETGLTLDGKFHLPIIGGRSQVEIECIEYVEVGRIRQLGKELGFGKLGERSHTATYEDMVKGTITEKFYCTQLTGYRQKLPDYPYHYVKDVKFQQAMKQFF